jgi:hypothetical protein
MQAHTESGATYRVRFDPSAFRRYQYTAMRRDRAAWVDVWLRATTVWSFFVLFVFLVGERIVRDGSLLVIVSVAVGIGAVTGFLVVWHQTRQWVEDQIRTSSGIVWTCELGPHAWSYDDGATKTAISWGALRIKSETDEFWEVLAGGQPMPIWRGPLRDAGLEEEFLGRLEQARPS